jgi:hypothetical protein
MSVFARAACVRAGTFFAEQSPAEGNACHQMYPSAGCIRFALPGKAKLNRIHILRHGSQNRFTALPQARAVGEVFARCFPPFHRPTGLERKLEFIKRALDFVPCYEFEFRPDRSSVAAVLGFANHD